jgi:hypothetical protein
MQLNEHNLIELDNFPYQSIMRTQMVLDCGSLIWIKDKGEKMGSYTGFKYCLVLCREREHDKNWARQRS